jgi:hypothetical protein
MKCTVSSIFSGMELPLNLWQYELIGCRKTRQMKDEMQIAVIGAGVVRVHLWGD